MCKLKLGPFSNLRPFVVQQGRDNVIFQTQMSYAGSRQVGSAKTDLIAVIPCALSEPAFLLSPRWRFRPQSSLMLDVRFRARPIRHCPNIVVVLVCQLSHRLDIAFLVMYRVFCIISCSTISFYLLLDYIVTFCIHIVAFQSIPSPICELHWWIPWLREFPITSPSIFRCITHAEFSLNT